MFSRRTSVARKWKLILVSHTHWDREWYLPFQQFRANLVDAVDMLLDVMNSDPSYRYFMLDGQTIMLEDYLEVRPEKKDELRRLIDEGRILVGPWYVMPDEFLVSGESLVRNLLEGSRTAASFGSVMKIGYVPDPFGHIAQLPQILKGFGIDWAVLWRGVAGDLHHNEALWESPDGSEVMLEYLAASYANAAVLPTAPDSLMERLAQTRSQLQPRATTDLLLLMNGNDHMLPQPDIPRIIAEANRRLRDAEIIHGTLPMFLEGVREQAAEGIHDWPRVAGELRSSQKAHILAGVLSARMNVKQRNAKCEEILERWAEPFSSLAAFVPRGDGTDRYSAAERLPADAPALLRVAWRYLLKNQPHDSICGCSVDQVHQEMSTRYDWCQQIGELVTNRALEVLASAVDTESIPPRRSGAGALVVFNSESGPRTDFATATVDLPGERSSLALAGPDGKQVPWQLLRERHTEIASATVSRSEVQGYLRLCGPGRDWPRWKLKILEKIIRTALRGRMPELVIVSMDVVPGADASTVNVEAEVTSGKEHDYDALSAGMRQLTNLAEKGDAQHFRLRVRRRDQADIGFVAQNLPGHGLKLLHFEPVAPATPVPQHSHPETTLENEYLSLQISPEDGTARLIDRETGTIYWDLNSFVDSGDAGDEYTYSPPLDDSVIRGPEAPPSITMEETGPARQLVRVDMMLRLPKALSEGRHSRAREAVPCTVTTWMALYPGVPRVDVRTTVLNEARDHRLRVLFPTHFAASKAHAEGQFAVIARPITPEPSAEGWIERPVGTNPQLTFVDISDGQSGLAIANRGLPEYEIVPEERGPTMALTLLRCVGWLSRDDLETRQGAAGPVVPTPGAQMLGPHTFEYSIIPHAGGWENAVHQARAFATPLAARWTGYHPGTIGSETSLLEVSPPALLVSAVKRPEDGSRDLIVRLYNVSGVATEGTLRVFFPLSSASLANLAEETVESLPLQTDGRLRFSAGGHRIITFRLTPRD